MVPGQVIEAGTIGLMRKLDVKEIHGFNASRGLKLLRADALSARRGSPLMTRSAGPRHANTSR